MTPISSLRDCTDFDGTRSCYHRQLSGQISRSPLSPIFMGDADPVLIGGTQMKRTLLAASVAILFLATLNGCCTTQSCGCSDGGCDSSGIESCGIGSRIPCRSYRRPIFDCSGCGPIAGAKGRLKGSAGGFLGAMGNGFGGPGAGQGFTQDSFNGPAGPATATYGYPYYTVRAPRDFLMNNPPSIGY